MYEIKSVPTAEQKNNNKNKDTKAILKTEASDIE